MSYLGTWPIDALLTFVCNTQVFSTGVATDADAVPTYRVYEDETGAPILTGSMALLDSANTAGFYSEQITLSAANGFENGKAYSIYIAATVSSVAGATHRTFQVQPVPDSAATIAAAVWATVIDGTNSAIKLMRGFTAALMGKASGLETTNAKYRNIADSKNVIDATVDADGNRTAVTLDLT